MKTFVSIERNGIKFQVDKSNQKNRLEILIGETFVQYLVNSSLHYFVYSSLDFMVH